MDIKKDKKDEFMQIRISSSLKATAIKAATEEGRSLSNYVCWLIRKNTEKINEDK